MAERKTKPTKTTPAAFLKQVENEQRRKDAKELLALMQDVTGEPPTMWGSSIIGYGSYRHRYAGGREADNMITGFSPRKQSLVLYLGPGQNSGQLRAKLGKHKATEGCLYINKLDDVDRAVLRKLIEVSVADTKKRYA